MLHSKYIIWEIVDQFTKLAVIIKTLRFMLDTYLLYESFYLIYAKYLIFSGDVIYGTVY